VTKFRSQFGAKLLVYRRHQGVQVPSPAFFTKHLTSGSGTTPHSPNGLARLSPGYRPQMITSVNTKAFISKRPQTSWQRFCSTKEIVAKSAGESRDEHCEFILTFRFLKPEYLPRHPEGFLNCPVWFQTKNVFCLSELQGENHFPGRPVIHPIESSCCILRVRRLFPAEIGRSFRSPFPWGEHASGTIIKRRFRLTQRQHERGGREIPTPCRVSIVM